MSAYPSGRTEYSQHTSPLRPASDRQDTSSVIFSFDPVDRGAGAAETVAAAAAALQRIAGVLHGSHDRQVRRHTVFFTEEIYIYIFSILVISFRQSS